MKIKLFLFLLGGLTLFSPVFATSPIRSWATDMYNQPSTKPFEEGSITQFPVGSVSIDGKMIHSDGVSNNYAINLPWADFTKDGFRYNEQLTPNSPLQPDTATIEKGAYYYGTYCSACHGADGKAQTNLGKMRAVPAINGLIPQFSKGYLYTRITYGGPNVNSMPPLGYSLSEEERWSIVEYIKNTFP